MRFRILGLDGVVRPSDTPGALGGHRGRRLYGRLDCPSANRWLARGHYAPQRVFFADEATAIAAGYRPCAACLPERYRIWKSATGEMTAYVAAIKPLTPLERVPTRSAP